MSLILLLFGIVIGMVQSAPVPPQISASGMALLELDGTQRHPVLLSPLEEIHAADEPLDHNATPIERASNTDGRIYDNLIGVELSVVLNMNGRVESAKPLRGSERFYEQAVALEMHREFEPVRNDEGTIMPAHFTDYVSIYPPERWLDHSVPFPEKVDLRTFRITLERTACYGSCPWYKVSVSGSGEVTWNGKRFVAVPGVHHAPISDKAIRKLVDQVRTSRMLDAQDEYRAAMDHSPTYILTLDVNGLHKQVIDYIGPIVGMPTSIRGLEEQIDTAAGTAKWTKANEALLPALTAEHWDFAAQTKDNLRLYDSMLEHENDEVLSTFTAAHGPVFSVDPFVESPVCVASKRMDSHTALEMLTSVP